jgi:hypothetical protein
MPAVAAHCLAHSKVSSGAKLRMLRAVLETMRSPRKNGNPNPAEEKRDEIARLDDRINVRFEETSA